MSGGKLGHRLQRLHDPYRRKQQYARQYASVLQLFGESCAVDDSIWTEPYIDVSGVGLVITVAKAVFDGDLDLM